VIALIDYKAGNLTSVKKALAAVHADVFVPEAPADLGRALGVIVPGVGHFGATRNLDAAWVDAILARVREGRPLLGICLGMQWLFDASEEAPELPGLGLLAGRCRRLSGTTADGQSLKVPHVGWNSLELQRDGTITGGVAAASQVYFTHSFVAPVTNDTVAITEHGEPFAAVVERGLVSGVQFHPEKSGDVGLRILRNFIALTS
jgi:glutamine amidotransferase